MKGSVLGAISTWGRRRVSISDTNLSVGQEKELMQTLGFVVWRTYEVEGGGIDVGWEGSDVVLGGVCLGRDWRI